MQERSVTIDGTSYALSPRFTVMATQNPVEHEGTYPLPEAQLDRFLFKLDVGYPPEAQEVQAVLAHSSSAGMPDLDALEIWPIVESHVIDGLRQVPARVRFEPDLAGYVVSLARATRGHDALAVGLSTRAAAMLAACSRAAAACEGRNYAIPDDIKSVFLPMARHRVVLSAAAEMEDQRTDAILADILERVPAPR
jgi:MoxR-like ATPase